MQNDGFVENLRQRNDIVGKTGILGALRTGAINTLATTQSIAQTVLSLAQATDTGPR